MNTKEQLLRKYLHHYVNSGIEYQKYGITYTLIGIQDGVTLLGKEHPIPYRHLIDSSITPLLIPWGQITEEQAKRLWNVRYSPIDLEEQGLVFEKIPRQLGDKSSDIKFVVHNPGRKDMFDSGCISLNSLTPEQVNEAIKMEIDAFDLIGQGAAKPKRLMTTT